MAIRVRGRRDILTGVVACMLCFAPARVAAGQMGQTSGLEVIVSKDAALLVQVGGEPIMLPVDPEQTVERMVNASYPLFRAAATNQYWIPVGKSWLAAAAVEGPYERSRGLPRALGQVAVPEIPPGAQAAKKGDAPTVYVRTHRAVLVRLQGPLRLRGIGELGGVHEVLNTDADLFYFGRDAHYYLLVGGRWFIAPAIEGPYEATADLPDAFRDIPLSDPKGYVVAAIPGTRLHDAAVRRVTRTQIFQVKATTQPHVRYGGAPVFERIPETVVSYALNTASDVFEVQGLYYCCEDATWFLASAPDGPWSLCALVPEELYAIPPDHPKGHVTAAVVAPAADTDALMVAAEGRYWGWLVEDARIVHRTWTGPFPRGVVRDGRYYGPYAEGPYLAPHDGNWGRENWSETRAELEQHLVTVAEPSAQGASGSEPSQHDNALDARRNQIEGRGGADEWWVGKDSLDERRKNVEQRNMRGW